MSWLDPPPRLEKSLPPVAAVPRTRGFFLLFLVQTLVVFLVCTGIFLVILALRVILAHAHPFFPPVAWIVLMLILIVSFAAGYRLSVLAYAQLRASVRRAEADEKK